MIKIGQFYTCLYLDSHMIPSPAELLYFYEVANSLNISRAAMKLGISQPSLSLAIKRVEKTVGTPLLVRHKQGVTMLPAGKKLLTHIKRLIQHWDETRSYSIASHNEVQGE